MFPDSSDNHSLIVRTKQSKQNCMVLKDEDESEEQQFYETSGTTCPVTCHIPKYLGLLKPLYTVKGLPQQAEVAQGVPSRLRPRIFLTFRHYSGGRSSALRTGRLYHRRNPWYSFLEAESTPGHMVLSVATEKNPQ